MLTLYEVLVNTAYSIFRPLFIFKRVKAKDEWNQRRCINPKENGRAPLLWGHASSMGEVRVLARLLEALQNIRPEIKFCISTYTKTGLTLARRLLPQAEAVFYFPLDCYFPLKRLFGHLRPDGIVMVETEIWPYFLDFCRRKNIPLVLANGRLSDRSFRRYKVFRRSLAPLLKAYAKFAMRTEADARRMIAIGAEPERVVVTGNIKHDPVSVSAAKAKWAEVRRSLGIPDGKLFLIAASTRPGEEEIICRALKAVSRFPDEITVLLAPRHLERLDEVFATLKKHEYSYVLYSEIELRSGFPEPVIIMDRMGILTELFYGADLAFVGGTLGDLGGHNVMEPVAAGAPVLFGPSVFNVKEAADKILEKKQGLMVQNAGELAEAIEQFAKGDLQFPMEDIASKSGYEDSEDSVAQKTARIIIEEFGL
jgi:3-deoxy-D-manno-octulosonic-acid transferase